MRIWRSLEAVPADLGRTVVTIGNFDGVHRGHQLLIQRSRAVADRLAAASLVVVTFDPHPVAVLRPGKAPAMLTPLDTRSELLGAAGADDVLVVGFDRDVANWSPERFVTTIVVDALRATAVVVGANFRFGHKAAGDVDTLRDLGSTHDFLVEAIALDSGSQVWSSTYVRDALTAGEVADAAEALGRPYAVRGVVARGDQRGRELGYPTANVPASVGLAVPADGVYAGWLRRLGDGSPALPAAISVGTNPTFEGVRGRRIESYVLDRDDLDLYDAEVEVSFVTRVRGMERFDSIDDLLAAMAGDVARVRSLLRTR